MRKISKIEPAKPHMPKRLRVAAYARVSSGKDAMLHSLAEQVSYYSDFIQSRPEWEFAGVYIDEAVTGTKGGLQNSPGDCFSQARLSVPRPEFQRLISDCRLGKIDIIVTKSISRFARNTVTLLETVRELKELGVDVFFEKENILVGPPESRQAFWGEEQPRNGKHFAAVESGEWRALRRSGDGELMLTILASYAQEESRSVSDNCKWRIRNGFKDGELMNWRFMYGYSIKKGRIEVREQHADVVRMIFEDYLNGKGAGAIAKKLNAMEIPTYNGGVWQHQNVLRVIQNEKFTGNALLQKKFVADHLSKKVQENHGELPKYYAEGTHPAIIDQKTFDAVQMELTRRRHKSKSSHNTHNTYPFTGKIYCENCGKRFKRKKNSGIFNWNCQTYISKGKAHCSAKQIPEQTLKSISAEVLGLDNFDELTFRENISEIRVPGANRLVFVFFDGTVVEREWHNRSRSESWTLEMKEQARQRQIDIAKKRRKRSE